MARRKGAEFDSRKALIDAVLEISAAAGFESASVDAIVARAGLSKGTFFHFFPTKQDVLEAACQRLAEEGWTAVKGILTEGGDNPLQKLARYLVEGRRYRVVHAGRLSPLWDALARDENVRVRASVKRRCRELVLPLFTRILEEGVHAGQFALISDAETTAELLLEFTDASSEETMRVLRNGAKPAIEKALRRVNATLDAVERILGAPAGTFERVVEESIEAFL